MSRLWLSSHNIPDTLLFDSLSIASFFPFLLNAMRERFSYVWEIEDEEFEYEMRLREWEMRATCVWVKICAGIKKNCGHKIVSVRLSFLLSVSVSSKIKSTATRIKRIIIIKRLSNQLFRIWVARWNELFFLSFICLSFLRDNRDTDL